MPNNVTAPAGGIAFATDEVGGVHFPYAKLAFGGEDIAIAVADSAGARLPVTVSGTVSVSGGLTNAELRAVPVPVAFSGQSVGINGTIGVTGPLTNAELRAAALPVSLTGQSVSINGTSAISAAALPLPAGASTEATLAALSAKLAALEGGRTPVAVQTFATLTRAYDYAGGQRLTTAGAGQVRSTAVAASEMLLHASVRGFFRVGDAAVSASVSPGSIPLAADEKFHLRLTSGQFVSFVRDGASDGSLTIMPVA
ncbi:hypothetical protein [Sandarakinorhabdus sp.]|uniref:hypothetical protein n=1 Tax=Sandarakinorhabdus sp. TaxID=1916663 RepID=UPI0035677AEC